MSAITARGMSDFNSFSFRALHGTADTDRHLLTLLALVVSMRAQRVLELGVHCGNTTGPLLAGCEITGGLLTSVDISPTPFQPADELAARWRFVQSDAVAFLKQETEPYDVVYIDDLHHAKHVAAELIEIERLTTPDSIVLLHDLMGEGRMPNYFCPDGPEWNETVWQAGGPYRAVAGLSTTRWEWATIPVGHGLTILRKKGAVVS